MEREGMEVWRGRVRRCGEGGCGGVEREGEREIIGILCLFCFTMSIYARIVVSSKWESNQMHATMLLVCRETISNRWHLYNVLIRMTPSHRSQ